MKYITKLKLASVHQYCDVMDKSTEFMYQFMQDNCKVSLDTVNSYFFLPDNEKATLKKEVNSLLNLIILMDTKL